MDNETVKVTDEFSPHLELTAFPACIDHGPLGGKWTSTGMSLRDYFAAAALSAFHRGHDTEQYHSDPGNTGIIASKCYALADAMLRERAKP